MIKECTDTEVLVMGYDDIWSDEGCVYIKPIWSSVRLCIAISVLQDLFKFCCRTGILLPQDDTFYVRNGEIRRYQNAKDSKTTTKETMGTRKERSRKGSNGDIKA